MKRFLMNLLLTIANTADNLASKLATNEPEPLLDYAGIVHYGEWHFGGYYAQTTPHGTHHIWKNGEYQGEYSGQAIEIVEQLHAKDQEHP